MIVIGLTGSIGMGKSTTARLFAEEGLPVWSADDAVHALYGPGGKAVPLVRAAFPDAVRQGQVDRAALSALLKTEPDALIRLEAIVHPLVAHDRTEFLERARASGAPVAVLDVPLLFEVGADVLADAVVVASAPAHIQRERVLAREGMDEAKLAALLERQIPDAHKRAKADFVIETQHGIEPARDQVRAVIRAVTAEGFRSRAQVLDEGGEPAQ
jgi:dephospho-CoA kinase